MSAKKISPKLQIRRDLSTNWTSKNPILLSGELGFETNTNKIKIGDGSSTWSALPYITDDYVLKTLKINGKALTSNLDLTPEDIEAAPAVHDHDDLYFTESEITSKLQGKVDVVSGKGLSTNDFTNDYKEQVDKNTNSRHDHSNKTILDNTSASYTTEEKTKLSGIAAGAEVNVQADWNVQTETSDAYIKNKPQIPSKISDLENDSDFLTEHQNISDRAKIDASNITDTGAWKTKLGYLTSVPTVGNGKITIKQAGSEKGSFTLNQGSDLTIELTDNDTKYTHPDTHPASMITGLATIATSGKYSDLSGAPTIPSVGNGTVTIKQNGSTKGSFTMNQSGNTIIELTDADSHHSSKNIIGNSAEATSNGTSISNDNVYLNHLEQSTVTSSHKIKGTGATEVTVNSAGDIVISSTNTTYNVATTSSNGLMSSADKTKLNNIATGAEVNVQADWDVTDTTSDAFIKNKPTDLATESYVDEKIADLISNDTEAIDTINELAAAFANNSDMIDVVTEAVGKKVDKVTSTDNAIARFDGTGGAIQNSKVTITDTGKIVAPSFASDTSEAGMVFSDNNELNFGSNSDTLYIGYRNKLNTSGSIGIYNFGTSSGSTGMTSGRINAGDIYSNGTKVATISHTHAKADITDFPTIGNGTITIKQNGSSKGSFTLNQTGNTTIELTDTDTITTIPTIGNGKVTIKQNGVEKGSFTMNQTGATTIELTDTDTDTNTTYSAGTGISLSGTTFSNAGVISITQDSADGHKLTINTGGTSKTITIPDNSVTYSTTAPLMDGIASVGTATTVARSDHTHPTDTSRAADGHTHTVTHTPTGTVSKPTITVTPTTASIKQITAVGTLPSLTATASNRRMTLTFSAGTLPTSASVTVATGIQSATSSQPTFTGTEATITTSVNSVVSNTYTITYDFNDSALTGEATYGYNAFIYDGVTYSDTGEITIPRGDTITLVSSSGYGSGTSHEFYANGVVVAGSGLDTSATSATYDYTPVGDVVITTTVSSSGGYAAAYLVDSGV